MRKQTIPTRSSVCGQLISSCIAHNDELRILEECGTSVGVRSWTSQVNPSLHFTSREIVRSAFEKVCKRSNQ